MELAKPDPARASHDGAASGPKPRALARATRKSVALSGGLSLALGPLGWIYAAPFKEAAPVIAAYLLLFFLLPKLLFFYVFILIHLAAGAAGVLYAWSYNREGRRLPLILKDPPPRLPPAPRAR